MIALSGYGTSGLRSILLFTVMWILLTCFSFGSFSQENVCEKHAGKRALKAFSKAERAYRVRDFDETARLLNETVRIEPDFPDAHYMLGLIYISQKRMNLKAAKDHFKTAARLCPTEFHYAFFHLARIYFGEEDFGNALLYITSFLSDPDRITSDDDYFDALRIEERAGFFSDMFENPVPFDPRPVEGICSPADEYLAIISPDNEMALFTRRSELPASKDDLFPKLKYQEKFMYSLRDVATGNFGHGEEMPNPFNRSQNEGGATITIDNKIIFFTLCGFEKGRTYYNCDICYSSYAKGRWDDIQNLGSNVNRPDTWESQPTVTSDGKTLYFISDRPGGFGGYDIYKTVLNSEGEWETPENLGPVINTPGNEKAPFIHTDSQTLYFSTDGRTGMGGYDIFYSRLNTDNTWSEPVNIGYPINTIHDDVGFFVSTNGKEAFFASNKYDGMGGWDLYTFSLYSEARPEKVLLLKGTVDDEESTTFENTRIDLKNVETKEITHIPVDPLTGDYVAAVLFRNDYVMTVKKKGYAYRSKYISVNDTAFAKPAKVDLAIEPIKPGRSYRLHDIHFDFNSYQLTPTAMALLDDFFQFLSENPGLTISIEGHTDSIGSFVNNQILSEQRAGAVYHYLISTGIHPERLAYQGFGESRPVAENNTEKGRALNRRTEFVIIRND